MARTPSSLRSPRSASSTGTPVRRSAGRFISCRRRNRSAPVIPRRAKCEPGISRFRVWSFGPSRIDARKNGARERTGAAATAPRATHVDSSLNLLATRSVIASMAAWASRPIAETTMDVPGPAESIINPMIEVPPTVSPPRVTQTSASKRRRSFAGENPAGNGDVFAAGLLSHRDGVGKRPLFANLGELDQHGKVDSGEHLHFRATHAGDREIGRCAAEHVGEDGDAVARVDTVDRLDDVASTQIRVVLGTDRDGFDLFLRTHDMFERRLELVGKAPMGHKY